jgi:hypothetical protein
VSIKFDFELYGDLHFKEKEEDRLENEKISKKGIGIFYHPSIVHRWQNKPLLFFYALEIYTKSCPA